MTTETSNARGEVLVPRELLEAAVCPMKESGCDGTQYPVQPYGEGEQCQWCYERRASLAAPPPAAARGDVRGLVAKLAAHVRPTCSELWDEAQAFLAAEGVQAGEVEQRARELLAAEYQKRGHGRESAEARASYFERHECAAFDAIARALSPQPAAPRLVVGWKPSSVEPPHNPKKDSLGTEYLIYPPTSSWGRTAFYGRRLGGVACWYRYGAQVHGVDYWQELPADPAALTGERNG